jgi:hypothetical protein
MSSFQEAIAIVERCESIESIIDSVVFIVNSKGGVINPDFIIVNNADDQDDYISYSFTEENTNKTNINEIKGSERGGCIEFCIAECTVMIGMYFKRDSNIIIITTSVNRKHYLSSFKSWWISFLEELHTKLRARLTFTSPNISPTINYYQKSYNYDQVLEKVKPEKFWQTQ